MSEVELKGMLESVAWRRVRAEWSKYLQMKPKLSMHCCLKSNHTQKTQKAQLTYCPLLVGTTAFCPLLCQCGMLGLASFN